jgi:hypothetical protein
MIIEWRRNLSECARFTSTLSTNEQWRNEQQTAISGRMRLLATLPAGPAADRIKRDIAASESKVQSYNAVIAQLRERTARRTTEAADFLNAAQASWTCGHFGFIELEQGSVNDNGRFDRPPYLWTDPLWSEADALAAARTRVGWSARLLWPSLEPMTREPRRENESTLDFLTRDITEAKVRR